MSKIAFPDGFPNGELRDAVEAHHVWLEEGRRGDPIDLAAHACEGVDYGELDLSGTTWNGVRFSAATRIVGCSFGPEHDVLNDGSDTIRPDRRLVLLNWGRIRIGEPPIFGVSRASLAVSLTYVNVVGHLNESRWLEFVSYPVPIPARMSLILASFLLLVIGSTMYRLACPLRVQQFSETEWVEARKHPRLLYLVESWSRRRWQLPTLVTTALGGLLALGLVLERLWWAAVYLWRGLAG